MGEKEGNGWGKPWDHGEYFQHTAWNTNTIFLLVFKINSLWKMTLELMLVAMRKHIPAEAGVLLGSPDRAGLIPEAPAELLGFMPVVIEGPFPLGSNPPTFSHHSELISTPSSQICEMYGRTGQSCCCTSNVWRLCPLFSW